MKNFYALNINQKVINSENCLKLLGVQINNKLSFGKHISTLSKKDLLFCIMWKNVSQKRVYCQFQLQATLI